ncbi:MAG: DUF4252 domain-containing protein [Dysgonamonadaceae bacterium]|jgi:hypothetical protein|nr:DUF4252 domain-containing protein [Dysgonamonadaceae bacterium]
MMNCRKHGLLFFLVLFSASVSAQDLITVFIDKHGKDDNLDIVTIGKKMIDRICRMSSETPELQDAIKGLENICIVSSKDADMNVEYYDSVLQLLTKKDFKELFSINEENEQMAISVKESKGAVKELVMLSNKNTGFNLIFISGEINIETLAKYADNLNIKDFTDFHTTEHKK